jgi:predicted DNA-binding transcriptional regulator AlpA
VPNPKDLTVKNPKPLPPPVDPRDPTDIILLSKAELLSRVPVTFTSIWRMCQSGKFPRGRVIGNRTVWVKSEVDAWLADVANNKLRGYRDDVDGTKFPDTFKHRERKAARVAALKKAKAVKS